MSLRARLLTLVLLATLLPALLLGWRFVGERDAGIAASVTTLARSADNIAADLENRVQGTAQLHYGLAHSRVLDGGDRAACSAYLSDVREAYPQYTGILTALQDGRLFCDSLRSGREMNLSDRAYFKRVMAGAPGVTLEPVFGRITGNSVLQIVYPARDPGGALRFMLVASLNLQKFVKDSQQQALHMASELLLMDRQGTVMAWSSPRAGLPKPGSSMADTALFRLAQSLSAGGTGELVDTDGQARVWAVTGAPAVRDAGLILLMGMPRQALGADAQQRLRQDLLILAAAALLLFAGVWLLAEWGIRRQVGRITRMVRELGGGKLDARIELPYPRGELGGLMAVLNSTAASLQRQRVAIDELGQRLRQAQKMEAVGTLAGGIAHDFNNVIGAILGNLSLAQESALAGRPAHDSLEQIRRAALRARELVQRIRSFSRSDTPALSRQPLQPLVDEVLALIRVTLPAGVTLHTELKPLPGPVWADATQLHQVLMNLCSNACQALQGQPGSVTVGLESVLLGADAAQRPAGLHAGRHARLWVRDTGCGIDAAIRERIFEPYFSTKGGCGGTGLGLSVVHGVAATHRGAIVVDSHPGQGSTFSLYLPVLDEAPEAAAAATLPAAELPALQWDSRMAPGAGERIVCVDDDEVMALMIERLLTRAGYRVSCHRGAQAALSALRADAQGCDLVLTDFNMPELSGLEFARALAGLRPGLPVVLMSGYIFDELPAQARRAGVCSVVGKQNLLEDLVPAVQRALAAAKGASSDAAMTHITSAMPPSSTRQAAGLANSGVSSLAP